MPVALGWVALAALCAGCHTFDAARRLAAPSPAVALTIAAPEPLRLEWEASYGESAYPDAILIGMFVRLVEQRGSWLFMSPVRICAIRPGDDEIVDARDASIGISPLGGYGWMPELDDAARERAAQRGCSHIVSVRGGEGRHAIAGIDLLPIGDGIPISLDLPRERPLLEPERWGWLVAAPVLDVVTIVAVPPVVLFMIAASALGYDF